MAKAVQSPDSMTTLGFPLRGIDIESPFDLQPPLTTPEGVNVRGFEPITLRARGGSRPGLARYIEPLETGSVIQHLDFIVDPQAEALTADTDTDDLPFIDYMDDPSTNNRRVRNPHNPGPRRVRRGGSGRQPNINITKQEVSITWSDPADIMVGTSLSDLQLNAVAYSGIIPIPGTFVYTPSAGTVLPLGTHTLRTVFTPTDDDLYRTARASVTIRVVNTKIDTYVDAPNVNLTDSRTLLAQGLMAVGRSISNDGLVAGTMDYSPARSTTPSTPSITITFTFTPTNTEAYNGSTLIKTFPVLTDLPAIHGNGVIESHGVGIGATYVSGDVVINPGEEDEYTLNGLEATWDPESEFEDPNPGPDALVGYVALWRYDPDDDAWFLSFAPF